VSPPAACAVQDAWLGLGEKGGRLTGSRGAGWLLLLNPGLLTQAPWSRPGPAGPLVLVDGHAIPGWGTVAVASSVNGCDGTMHMVDAVSGGEVVGARVGVGVGARWSAATHGCMWRWCGWKGETAAEGAAVGCHHACWAMCGDAGRAEWGAGGGTRTLPASWKAPQRLGASSRWQHGCAPAAMPAGAPALQPAEPRAPAHAQTGATRDAARTAAGGHDGSQRNRCAPLPPPPLPSPRGVGGLSLPPPAAAHFGPQQRVPGWLHAYRGHVRASTMAC